jgi:hypothetical protein
MLTDNTNGRTYVSSFKLGETLKPKVLFFGCMVIAFLFTLGILISLGPVGNYVEVYPGSTPYYNFQASALAHKQFALSHDPRSLGFDLVWGSNGDIQQPWGLGVPAWITVVSFFTGNWNPLFFPSRIAFALALWLISWIALQHWATMTSRQISVDNGRDWHFWLVIIPTVGILFLFPSFCALLKSCFRVYEEACTYAYMYELLLFILLLRVHDKPTTCGLVILYLAAGAGVFIRPTVALYGLAAALCGFYAVAGRKVSSWKLLLGCLAFIFAVTTLMWTNFVRFGSPLEFGHSLALSYHLEYVYPTRFGFPFQSEPLTNALKELLGGLLFDGTFNGGNWFQNNVFRWQSITLRWRQAYLPSIGWPMVGLCLTLLLLSWGTKGKDRRTSLACAFGSLAFCGLVVFYTRCPVLSSRYLYDFSLALAAVGAIGWWQTSSWLLRKGFFGKLTTIVAGLGICIYLCVRAQSAVCAEQGVISCSRSAYKELLNQSRLAENTASKARVQKLGTTSEEVRMFDIPYNAFGWEWRTTGALRAMSLHFCRDIEYLEIDISRSKKATFPAQDQYLIRAKIGLEELTLESVETIAPSYIRLRFRPPQRQAYRKGIQQLALAWVSRDAQGEEVAPWLLHKIGWGSGFMSLSEKAGGNGDTSVFQSE